MLHLKGHFLVIFGLKVTLLRYFVINSYEFNQQFYVFFLNSIVKITDILLNCFFFNAIHSVKGQT